MASRPSPHPFGADEGEGDQGTSQGLAAEQRRAKPEARDGLGRTRRERLRELLFSTEEGLSLEEIERLLEARRQTLIQDLEHLRLSFKHQSATLLMVPPSCTTCGYTFRLQVPKAPSRCPQCKSRSLSEPIFKAMADA